MDFRTHSRLRADRTEAGSPSKRSLLFAVLLCAAVLTVAACGGSPLPTQDRTSASEVDNASDTPSSSDRSESSDPACDLLTISEIEVAIGRVVTEVVGLGNTDGFGACIWEFEPLTEGVFEGAPPELTVQTFRTEETYDNDVLGYPGQPAIDGIGDGAVSRTDGEVTFSANGHSGRIGSLLAFEVGQEDAANAAVRQLAALVVDRL